MKRWHTTIKETRGWCINQIASLIMVWFLTLSTTRITELQGLAFLYPEGTIWHCSWFPRNLKGNLYNVWSPWCPVNEGGGCLQSTCSRNLLRRHQAWLRMEQHIYKRENDGIYIRNLKGAWEKHLLAALPLLLLRTPLMSVAYPPRILASELCWSCCCHRATSAAGRFTPGTVTN